MRAGRIDIVVVYKVDRLTRSLPDFAKLVEIFDAHGVSFVSVTQSFNTTSSMGRLTLNVLLSFAQFEREVIGERVRDKIAASKRKGIWVGGPVPLGYRVADKRLVAVPGEAMVVRTIFERYLALASLRLLADDLAERGVTPRPRMKPEGTGTMTAEARFLVGPLGHILRNRCYIGEVVYRGEAYPAEHAPIVDRAVFDAVQTRLGQGSGGADAFRSPSASRSPLMGLLFDSTGHRMSPSHTKKKGVRYRYYVSQAVLQSGRKPSPEDAIARVSAQDLEALVLSAVRQHLRLPAGMDEANTLADRMLLVGHVHRVIFHPREIVVTLLGIRNTPDQGGEQIGEAIASATPSDKEGEIGKGDDTGVPGADQTDLNGPVLAIPWSGPKTGARLGLLSEPDGSSLIEPAARDALLLAIAKARVWMEELTSGQATFFAAIAEREGKGERHIRLLAPLAFVSPGTIAALIEGAAPAGLSVTALARELPLSWTEQERRYVIR